MDGGNILIKWLVVIMVGKFKHIRLEGAAVGNGAIDYMIQVHGKPDRPRRCSGHSATDL